MVRTSVIETDSPEWHSGARPSSYVRNDAWWVTLESNQAGTKARALQARSVPRLDITQKAWRYPDWLRERYSNARLVVMSHARGLVTLRSSREMVPGLANSSAAPAYVRPGAIVDGGEPRT